TTRPSPTLEAPRARWRFSDLIVQAEDVARRWKGGATRSGNRAEACSRWNRSVVALDRRANNASDRIGGPEAGGRQRDPLSRRRRSKRGARRARQATGPRQGR